MKNQSLIICLLKYNGLLLQKSYRLNSKEESVFLQQYFPPSKCFFAFSFYALPVLHVFAPSNGQLDVKRVFPQFIS